MNIFMTADLEGVSGVVDFDKQANPGSAGYSEARKHLMAELNSAVEGAVEAGVKEVLIFDMHFWGLNVILEELHPQARVVLGKPAKIYPSLTLDSSFKGLMMIGFHARAGAPGGLLTHTYDHSIKNLYLNQRLIGEIGMEAAIAGTYDIPLIMLSGDSKAIEESKAFSTPPEAAEVKYAINEHSAICWPLSQVKKLIKEKARTAVEKIDQFSPFHLNPPFQIQIEFFHPQEVQKALSLTGVNKISELKVEIEGNNLPLLWERFISQYQGYD